jgi:hypothetical protein
MTFVGAVSPDDIRRGFAERARLVAGRPRIFLMIDLSRVTSVSPAARKAIGDHTGGVPVLATVVIGAPFAIRTLATLVSKGVQILRGVAEPSLAFFDSEAEGRAWLVGRGQGVAAAGS